jgi:hypothetical protein
MQESKLYYFYLWRHRYVKMMTIQIRLSHAHALVLPAIQSNTQVLLKTLQQCGVFFWLTEYSLFAIILV